MTQRFKDTGAFFINNPNPMWIYDPDTLQILEVNDAATELYGYSKQEMKSLTLKDIRPDNKVPNLLDEVAKNVQAFSNAGIWKHQNSKKEPLFVRILSYPIQWKEKMCKMVVAQNVTDQIRVEQKLKQSREQLQKIMDHSPAVICTIDREGRFVQVSAAAKSIWGYRPEELMGKPFIDFVHPDDTEATRNVADAILSGTQVTDFENRYVRKDDSTAPMEWSARWDPEDQLMYGVGIDASEINQMQEELTRERNMLRAIIDNLPVYIYVKDTRRRLIVSNRALYKDLLGHEDEQDTIGKTAYDINKPEIAKPIDADDRKVIETGQPIINREETAYDHEGNKLELLTTKVPMRDANNEIIGLVGITRDVTEQKKANEQLRLSKQRYNLVAKATQDAVYDWDILENELFWDDSFKSLFVHDSDQGKYTIETWASNVHPEDLPRTQQSLNQALESPTTSEWEAEYRFKKADGSYANILERGFIMRNDKGEAVRMIGALQDVTELKQKEREIHQSLKEKETLLAEVHHRVKNNLAVVSGMMQLQAFEEEDKKLKDKLLDSVTRIRSMANIHEQMYQTNNFSNLEFSENLKILAKRIIDIIQVETQIKLDFSLQPIYLSVNQAIPCSLIVNEVVTNILKHAFEGKKKGHIGIELTEKENEITLLIKDDGGNLPASFDTEENKTLGLQLIEVLTKQLEGNYDYESLDNDSAFTLTFKKSDMKGIGSSMFNNP